MRARRLLGSIAVGMLAAGGSAAGMDLDEAEGLPQLRAQAAREKGTRGELSAWIGIQELAAEADDAALQKEALGRMMELAEKFPAVGEAVEAAMTLGDSRLVPAAEAERVIRKVLEKAANPEMKGYARHALACVIARGEMTPARLGEIIELRDRIEKEHVGKVSTAALDHWLDRFGGFVGETPDFDATDADGKPFKLSDYRGKVTAVVFWATWCKPCMADVPHEIEVARRFKERPFAIVGVNADKGTAADVKAKIEKAGIPWRNAVEGSHAGPIVKKWGVKGWPTVVVLDQAGKVRYVDARGEDLDRAVEMLLGESARQR